jgi:20S proteasome alpha/beta subunit
MWVDAIARSRADQWSRAAGRITCSTPVPTRSPIAPGRLQSPYSTNLLMAGYDDGEGGGPSLYWCDYLATLHHMNICGTGYGETAVAGG